MYIDECSLAAAIRDAGIAEGQAALNLAADLVLRLETPTPEMMAEAAIERAAMERELNNYFARSGATP
jgi:hypothetical protein